MGYDEANKLAKKEALEPHILESPFHLISHQTPFGHPIPQHPPNLTSP